MTELKHRYLMIDPAAGSNELIAPMQKLCSVEVQDLVDLGGDCAWYGGGRGPDNEEEDWLIGLEYKKLPDLIDSIRYGRLAATQIPRMVDTYRVRYLVIEGLWKPDEHGQLCVPARGGWIPYMPGGSNPIRYDYIDNFLTSMEDIGGFRIRRTGSKEETIQVIHNLFRRWAKPWWEHESLGFAGGIGGFKVSTQVSTKADYLWKAAAELTGVGVGKAQQISLTYQRSMLDFVLDVCGISNGWENRLDAVRDTRGAKVLGLKLRAQIDRIMRKGY